MNHLLYMAVVARGGVHIRHVDWHNKGWPWLTLNGHLMCYLCSSWASCLCLVEFRIVGLRGGAKKCPGMKSAISQKCMTISAAMAHLFCTVDKGDKYELIRSWGQKANGPGHYWTKHAQKRHSHPWLPIEFSLDTIKSSKYSELELYQSGYCVRHCNEIVSVGLQQLVSTWRRSSTKTWSFRSGTLAVRQASGRTGDAITPIPMPSSTSSIAWIEIASAYRSKNSSLCWRY